MPSTEISTSTDEGEVFIEGTTAKDRLRITISNVEAEEQRLAALEAGRDRCRQQQWHARTKLSDAQEALKTAQTDRREDLAYKFLNDNMVAGDRVGSCKLAVEAAQADIDQLEAVESAIGDEIGRSQRELSQLRQILYSRMADLVVDSMEYEVLLAQHKEAWTRLRSIKQAMRVISAGLHGALPNRYAELVNLTEPLEPRLGYEMQSTMIESWEMALTELESNADVDLPLFG